MSNTDDWSFCEDEQDDDETNKEEDFFASRTWKIVETFEDGFSIGSCFTYRDIVLLAKTSPGLEGTVFKNTKTGKTRKLRNKNINAKRIISLVNKELSDESFLHLIYGLSYDRDSVFLLWTRIKRSNYDKDMFKDFEFFDLLLQYVGENDISEADFDD